MIIFNKIGLIGLALLLCFILSCAGIQPQPSGDMGWFRGEGWFNPYFEE